MGFRKVGQATENEQQRPAHGRVAATELESNDASRASVYGFALIVFFVVALLFVGVWSLLASLTVLAFVLAACVGLLVAMGVRVAPEWERVVILRLGKFRKIAGPGPYFCIPFIDSVAAHVDQRTTTTSFSAEEALTADSVPVDVDAILFWMVWDAEKACLEVKDYPKAVLRSAQTALRDAIGQQNLADISTRRRQIDHELGKMLDSKCGAWGITVLSVEIRDIVIPEELQGALSCEAQAERERNARLMLAEVEKDISEMFVDAAAVYSENPDALRLRAMNLAYEGICGSGGVVLAPSDLASAFNLKGQG